MNQVKAIYFDIFGVLVPREVDRELLDYILDLRQRGIKVGILSNIRAGCLDNIFSKDELSKYFDGVISSGQLGTAKPYPEIYQTALRKFGVEPNEAVFVDDNLRNVRGAEEVGMKAILYKNFADFREKAENMLK
jgi:HAD superfamily hydrolase (TIGR01509 family)